MKRNCLLNGVLLLAVLIAVTGCGQNNPPPNAGNTPAPAAASSAAGGVPAEANPATPAVPGADSVPVAETAVETTETGTTVAAGPALALRIADVKPEPASQWKEGQHYKRLMPVQPTSAGPGQVEVMEFFWYACPHCNALDPYLETWRQKNKPSYASFVRVPVMWSQMHGLHARIYYTAQALGKLDALHSSIFAEFHQVQNPLNSTEAVTQFFVKHGIAQADFQRAFTSQAVNASLQKAQELELRFKVESVPYIVINGKYVTDVGMAGGPTQLISLINELVAREHGT